MDRCSPVRYEKGSPKKSTGNILAADCQDAKVIKALRRLWGFGRKGDADLRPLCSILEQINSFALIS